MNMHLDLATMIWVFVAGGLATVVFLSLASRSGSPDPSGERPRSIYLHTVMFISLILVVFGVFRAVEGIVLLVTAPDPQLREFALRGIAAALLLAIAAGGVFRVHRARAHPYSAVVGYASTPGGRVALIYFLLGCFAAVAIGVAAILAAAGQVLDVIWPDVRTYGSPAGGTGGSVGRVLILLALSALMVALYRAYWSAAERGRAGSAAPDLLRVGMAEAADLAETMAVEDDPPQE